MLIWSKPSPCKSHFENTIQITMTSSRLNDHPSTTCLNIFYKNVRFTFLKPQVSFYVRRVTVIFKAFFILIYLVTVLYLVALMLNIMFHSYCCLNEKTIQFLWIPSSIKHLRVLLQCKYLIYFIYLLIWSRAINFGRIEFSHLHECGPC